MKFSVIIPVYNAEKYIKECLDSILNCWPCRGGEGEIICVDDGSTDGSAQILDNYKTNILSSTSTLNFNFIVIHQQNAGVSVARNKGLEVATGDYVCFVDSDDTVHPNWLSEYAAAIEANPGVDLVRLSNEKWHEDYADERRGYMFDNGYPWSYCVRREVAIKARFPEGVAMGEDSLYLLRLFPHIQKLVQLHEMTYNYRVSNDSAMHRGLASVERVKYLAALYAACEQLPNVDVAMATRSCAHAILAWCSRPNDKQSAAEIRAWFKKFQAKGWVDARYVGALNKVPYAIYLATGWVWPVTTWFKLVSALVQIKKGFKI